MSDAVSTRPTATTTWLVDQLRHAIIEGAIPEGAALRQTDIASQYDVSRMPVREAINRLEAEGWVEHHPHKGSYVVRLDAEDAREIFAIRAALETLAVSRAFPALSTARIEKAEGALKELEIAEGDVWFAAHKRFHLSLYEDAGRRLCRLIAQQLDAAERYLRLENAVLDVADKDRREHRALLDAARAGDAARAAETIRCHVAETGDVLARCLGDRAAGEAP